MPSTVLVIDDEPFILKVLMRQLHNLGYTDVVGCEQAATALATVAADPERIAVIICDLDMPQMDGVEFIRHLAGTAFGGGLVLISGEDSRVLQSVEHLALAHRLHVLGALQKPVASSALAAVLSKVADRDHGAPLRKEYELSRLRQALDWRELVNHYQPQVSVDTGALVAVEALVRWQHPSDGLVFPDQFIHLAEENGLIDRLTELVLVRALSQARAWERAGLTVNVSVNVSMENLSALAFPDFVSREAQLVGIATSRLVLEVTESRLMKDRLASLDILTRLRLKGVALSIDDFGTGHSSLAQLRDIPFNELKIDRSFTRGVAADQSLRAIFNASLGMAGQLGMSTVAEGVETDDDWHFLKAAGCGLAQGYFIGKPMPADALPRWLESWQTRYAQLSRGG